MNTSHLQAGVSLGRRRLLGVMTGAGLTSWMPFAAAAPDQPSYALTSIASVLALRSRVPAASAQQLIAHAQVSLGRQPHLMAVVHTEGLLDGEGERIASRQAQEDWRQAGLQALAFRLGGAPEHARSAERYLLSWVPMYTPSYNPIDETDLVVLLYAFDLMQDGLSPQQNAAFHQLGRHLAEGYLAQPIRVGAPSSAKNNWQCHRIKLATAGAFLCGDTDLIAQAKTAFERQLMINIDANGQCWDFVQRDALHYVVYMLEPMLMSATMAAAHGQDWLSSPAIEDRLRKAIDWLSPFALGTQQHEEFARTTVEFDRRRARAGVPGYRGVWKREEAATVYWLAARLDVRFDSVRRALPPPPLWVQGLYPHQ